MRRSGFNRPREMRAGRSARHCLSGTSFWTTNASPIRTTVNVAVFSGQGLPKTRFRVSSTDRQPLTDTSRTRTNSARFVAEAIADGKVVGWMQGRMEFGPRALGGRSILGDARSREMQSILNLKIKFRESFRPFAPVVLRDRLSDYFDMNGRQDSPYMLLVANVSPQRMHDLDGKDSTREGLDKLRVARSDIPAVTHVDGSARVQTVDAERHGRFHRLLKAFESQTDTPVLINTSFNVRGEPIVCTPADAYRCFLATDMDLLVMERFVLDKTEQPADKQRAAAEYATNLPPD